MIALRWDDSDPHWRIRLERAEGELAVLSEERCTSRNDTAQVMETHGSLWLTQEDVRWLHEALVACLADMRADPGGA